MIQESLYSKLAGAAGVTALVGTRIYPLVIPQTVYSEATKKPCIVYSTGGKGRQIRFGGTDTLVSGSFTVDCYARSYASVQALAAAVRAALVDQSGTWTDSDSPTGSVAVQQVFIDNEYDLMDEEPGLYRVVQEYSIWYDEA